MARARIIAEAGGVSPAIAGGALPLRLDLTLSEALVLGLLRQGVTRFVGVFGHGSTELAEVLRLYQEQGLCRTFAVRNEVAAAHAAMALRWVTGEKAAVFTSIGPGALHALAGSLAAASDGIGVWHLYGDETTEEEGPNMQQIPRHDQGMFLRLCSAMGQAFCLQTPQALGTALRRGHNTVDHPFRPGPFYLLMPMNTQPQLIRNFNLSELAEPALQQVGPAADGPNLEAAVEALLSARRVVVKLGQGARGASAGLAEFVELVDGVVVWTPIATGIFPASHPRAMAVGGSKGSLCGNHAMENADLLVAVGTRFVCQSDSSRTGYPQVERVVTINPDPYTANHYGRNIPLLGDANATLRKLSAALRSRGRSATPDGSPWLTDCQAQRRAWDAFKRERYETPVLHDERWGRPVLTQPAAIKVATDWARQRGAISFFDAGDVQANGFQVVEDEQPGMTFTDTGASYMGFAVSALMATALASRPFYGLAFTGDGSFTMNPQILIDGANHGATGCILLMDNRAMGAIWSLQKAQYGQGHATWDEVCVDYLGWARSVKGVAAFDGGSSPQELRAALDQAGAHQGLSLVHLPVYFGDHPMGGLGAFGRWNVGSWVEEVQALRHHIGL